MAAELTVRFWLSDAAPWQLGRRIVWSARSPVYHVDAVVLLDGEETARIYEVALVRRPEYAAEGDDGMWADKSEWHTAARRRDATVDAVAEESAGAPMLQHRYTGEKVGDAIAVLQRHVGDEATEFPRRMSQTPLLGLLLPGVMRLYWCLPSSGGGDGSDARPPVSCVSYIGVALAAADTTQTLWPVDPARTMLDWSHEQLHAVVRESNDFDLVSAERPTTRTDASAQSDE
jgi:hypothetical protein